MADLFIYIFIFYHFAITFEMDGWMTCDFTSFLTVFQLHVYQNDGWVIMEGCVQRNPVYDRTRNRNNISAIG